MTTLTKDRTPVALPPVRQDVVDRLAGLLAIDDVTTFAAAVGEESATRAETAAAAAGLVESGALDLAALQHALEVLEGVARLPDPDA